MSLSRITQILEDVVGCNLTRLIQVSDHSIAITIADPGLSQTDTITINGVACEFVSDATPTKKEVSDGLIAAILASAQAANVVVAQGAAPDYNISVKTANALDPTVAVSANLADTATDGYARINGAAGARLLGMMFDANSTGVITLADAGSVKQILPIGMLKATRYDFFGARFNTRLEIKVDAVADLATVFWATL